MITAKCADSIPHDRLEKAYKRIGIPIARSTMTDLLHQAAAKLQPLADRTLQRIAQSEIVQADETSIKVQAPGKCRTGFMWTFVADNLIGYRFSPNRSGETPREVLGGTDRVLVVDGYTGYNSVVDVDGRNRCGCHAHVRPM